MDRAEVRVGAAKRWRAGMASADPMRVWGLVKRQRTCRNGGGGDDGVLGVLLEVGVGVLLAVVSSWDVVDLSFFGPGSELDVIGVGWMSAGGD